MQNVSCNFNLKTEEKIEMKNNLLIEIERRNMIMAAFSQMQNYSHFPFAKEVKNNDILPIMYKKCTNQERHS